ncbi:MAG: hypothetical protein IJT01_08900 [Selenomonadaceae bacterium]|nr:hypothetical protein [Selenomonadaceae bacterium]
MTDKEIRERYEDSAEFRDAVKGLPQVLKQELIKGVSLLELGYRIGLTEGQRRREATA